MNETRRTQALKYLHDHNVATLATSSMAGTPWAAALFYANNDTTLYFLSSPTSRHCLNMQENPRVAVTIQEEYSDWLEIKGIQIEGIAGEISGDEEKFARRLYGEKFPLVGLLNHAPEAIVRALAKVSWYKIVPQRVYFIDNSHGLGSREEVPLDPETQTFNYHPISSCIAS